MGWVRPHIPIPEPTDRVGPGIVRLTELELRYLRMRCIWQLSNKEIGERVGRSENTIKAAMGRVYVKLGCRSIERACYELGVCDMDEAPPGFRAESV